MWDEIQAIPLPFGTALVAVLGRSRRDVPFLRRVQSGGDADSNLAAVWSLRNRGDRMTLLLYDEYLCFFFTSACDALWIDADWHDKLSLEELHSALFGHWYSEVRHGR